MSLPTLIRHRQAKGASPGEVAELEAAQARIQTLEAALAEARDALLPYLRIVPGTHVLNRAAQVSERIDALLEPKN